MSIATQPRPGCPVCGGSGPVARARCPDPVFGLAGPGADSWTFRRCARCGSLWLDPRPVAPDALYPEGYYTHTPPTAPLAPPRGAAARAAFALKLALLEHAYGYAGRAPGPLAGALGRALRFVPGFARWAGFMVRFVPAPAGGTPAYPGPLLLLDVGCGNGAYLLLMQALGWRVEGIEPDPAAAEPARAAGLAVQVAALADAELAPERYAAITLHHVFEHLPDPAPLASRLAAALRPGGRLVSISPNPDSWLGARFGPAWRGLEPPRHFVLPGRAGYRTLFEPHGLRVRAWTSQRTAPWMVPESLAIRRTGRIASDPASAGAVLALLAQAAAPLLPGAGEEVICVAEKPAG